MGDTPEPATVRATTEQVVASAVVFDFDHTLTDRDCSARFFRWLIGRERWRWAFAVCAMTGLLPLWLHPRTRRFPARTAIWIATLGRSHADLEALTVEHVVALHGAGVRLLREDARAELLDHLGRASTVAIATGALQGLVETILAGEGIEGVIVVGSSLRRWYGGMAADVYCYGRRKPALLAERGIEPPYACAYSDHSDDIPLLERAMQRYAINPRPTCWVRMQARFGGAVQRIDWR